MLDWTINNNLEKNGRIEIMSRDGGSIGFKMEFANAFGTSATYIYDSISSESMNYTITVTAGILRINSDDSTIHKQTWDDGTAFNQVATESTEQNTVTSSIKTIPKLDRKPLFVPLVIPEKRDIKFIIDIEENDAEKLLIQVRQGNSVIYQEEINNGPMLKVGSHTWCWDGSDKNGILDTKLLTDYTNLNLLSKVWYKGEEEFETVDFKAKYSEVDWLDVKVDKNAKRIDVTLRINLADKKIDSTVNKTFNDLLQLSKEGLIEHWGRNNTRALNGKSINISGVSYELYVTPVNTTENSMPKLKVYAFKHKDGRSRNWWLSRKLYYNEDYTYDIFQEVNISHNIQAITKAAGLLIDEKEFKHTAAHEIGHEILQAFGGKNNYSYVHKGTSTLLTQKVKASSTIPSPSEIDLMKYFVDDYFVDRIGYIDGAGNAISGNNFYNRSVASEIDVLGLIWCSKIEIK